MGKTPDPELTIERVLTAVELIPPGRVVSYGDLAELVGTSARRVGRVMATHGAGVPWWRVTNAAGAYPPELLERAFPHWAEEGILLAPSGRGCRIATYRADLPALAEAYAAAVADLDGGPDTEDVLVVDAANVIGSVPDGWWRDRPGAAARLHDALVAAPGDHDRVLLVLEGRARSGVPETVQGAVQTVHAPGSGDDEIVRRCRELAEDRHRVTLATADRGLIARVDPLGVRITAPRRVRQGVQLNPPKD
ncbi:alkylated DNA nucleotide flippase Atl1 [Propionibacteriaceae bacterium ES.041]|uniref:MGMT family protein n=1 Tax=Enemella evansiae TaxID=2016499 RepID=UPI000C00A71C|nr:MGMT family protein [Enemella evansiae]PFG66367.1 alkylated DNA nucleotide flippase Atl1 [Propionibacteriaceae bacterium ES.041]TDO88040.1 alkylated DNA nucleotide flippase Atl1 [Enemella evansiae]